VAGSASSSAFGRRSFERYLALNILHPWLSSPRAILPYAWRFTYQLVVMAPVLGYELRRRGRFVPRVLVSGSTRKEVWDPETVSAFATGSSG